MRMIILWLTEIKTLKSPSTIFEHSFIYTAKGKRTVEGNYPAKYTKPHVIVLIVNSLPLH